ncbi:MAG: hypothetical protein M3Z14_00170 [Candidatus Eremiobacteraeota bacterium]|nr:hypothetical protein [Candidatus Eremiobacteraeota bacterium]
MLKTTLTLMCIVMCNALFFNSSAVAQSVSRTFETLTPALAFVSYGEGYRIRFGTALVSDLSEMFENAGLHESLAMGPGVEALKKAGAFFSFAARSTGTVPRGRP